MPILHRNNWGNCESPNKDNIERFTALLAKCMKKAVDAGKDIAVLAHLDNMQVRQVLWWCQQHACKPTQYDCTADEQQLRMSLLATAYVTCLC